MVKNDKKIKILKEIFFALFSKIKEKCSLDIDVNRRGASFFGFGIYSDRVDNIKYLMLAEPEIMDFLINRCEPILSKRNLTKREEQEKEIRIIFNGKYLYNKSLAYKRGKNPIQFLSTYLEVYLRFIGFDSLEDFIREDEEITREEIHKQNVLASSIEDQITDLAIKFKGFYVSKPNHILPFHIKIDYLNNFRAIQSGFHSLEEKYDESNSDTFVGNGVIQKNCIYFSLKSTQKEVSHMSLFLYVGGMKIQKMNYVIGTLSTVSVHGHIYSGEIFLKRETEGFENEESSEKDISKELQTIKRYLNLKQCYFKTPLPSTTIEKLTDIENKNRAFTEIKKMVGIWRIWSLTMTSEIYQSIFTINPDFSSTLKTTSRKEDVELICHLSLSFAENGWNLMARAYEEEENNSELRNIAMIKIPSSNRKIATGSFCGLGVYTEHYTFGAIAMICEKQEDFKSKTLRKPELYKMLSNMSSGKMHRFKDLYETLREHNEDYLNKKKLEEFENLDFEDLDFQDVSQNMSME